MPRVPTFCRFEVHADVQAGARYRLVLPEGDPLPFAFKDGQGDGGARVRRWLVLVLVLAGCGGAAPHDGGRDTLPGALPSGVTFAPATSTAAAPPFSLALLDGTRVERGGAVARAAGGGVLLRLLVQPLRDPAGGAGAAGRAATATS